jgi:hypothetical protein
LLLSAASETIDATIATQEVTRAMSEPSKNEGEGNRTADRKYREDVRRHVESGAVEPAAEEAREALEGPEAEELHRAEEEGKAARTKHTK